MKRIGARAFICLLSAGALGASSAVVLAACEEPAPVNPFLRDAGEGGGGGGGGGMPFDAGPDADPTLGGPCTVDSQCDDQVDCTFDSCDQELLRCRFQPDDSQCQNDVYCDGVEVCENLLGCILGAPITCSDGSPCTINTCDESDDTCQSEPRDADQDGDPDVHCGGGDCDDLDPLVASTEYEICGNGRDDDCDDQVDEVQCFNPQHDKCLAPLDINTPGTYAMSTAAAALDYSASCNVMMPMQARDVVAAINLAAGPLMDVQLTARTDTADVALALMGQCGQPGSEIACSPGFEHPDSGRVAKVRGRSLGDVNNALALPAYVFTEGSSNLTLRYELLSATTKPTNETCGTAITLVPDTPTLASVVDANLDVAMGCGAATGELVFQFDLLSAQNVDIYATSTDGDGLPVVSLRNANCALPGDEVTCASASNAHIFRHSLPAGTHYVAVAATAPTDVLVNLQLSAPTAAPADEDCSTAPALVPNVAFDVLLDGHQDDHNTGCLQGGVDAAYALDLTQSSDVLIVGRYSNGDQAAVELATPPCADPMDQLECATSSISPARAQRRNLAAGSYRVIAESFYAQPLQITALVRPAVPPTIVAFANTCNEIVTIPSAGGFFQGNTTNAQPDFNANCDLGNQPQGTANDQILQLTLTQPKRVVLDMQGSGYTTILNVREGQICPGTAVPQACAAGYFAERSFLDLQLQPSTYYVQVDGYNGDTGPWFLDVYVVDP